MEITPKARPVKNQPTKISIFINVHDGGQHPIARPSVKGVKINKSNWNKKGTTDKKNWVKTSEPNHRVINQKIHDLMIQLEAELKGFTTKEILVEKDKAISGGQNNFVKYFETQMNDIRNLTTKENDKYAIRQFKLFLEANDLIGIQFKDINNRLVKDMYNYFLENCSVGSANQYFDRIKNCYNNGVADEDLKFSTTKNPFFKFKKESVKKVNRGLTKSEFYRFKRYEAPINKPKWKHAQMMWLFELWGAFRVKDVIYMKWHNVVNTDNGFMFDFFTSKNGTRVFREIPFNVLELLIPQMALYYPELVEEYMSKVAKNDIQKKKRKSQPEKKELSKQEIFQLYNEGMSMEDIMKIDDRKYLTNTPEQTESFNELLDSNTNKMMYNILDMIINNNGDEFIFNHGKVDDLTHFIGWDKDEFERYKNAATKNYGALQSIRKKLDIKVKFTAHVARHTATQFMLDGGASNHEISEYLTHSNLVTMEKYRQTLGNNAGKLSTTLSDFIGDDK
ncbi:site-specific integrase [Gillisia sp. JM1]|uniref:site-specific integrase n=1 Tax=Gillisia sp. JM1 TaxID=1283286 RepID=UPI0004120DD7|nr:site-specific integrase [Gillisia sp. JM1]